MKKTRFYKNIKNSICVPFLVHGALETRESLNNFVHRDNVNYEATKRKREELFIFSDKNSENCQINTKGQGTINYNLNSNSLEDQSHMHNHFNK